MSRNITKTGQIGDGREAAAADYVVANARQGDLDDVIADVDQFAYEKSILINVGDEKGELLDAAVRRADPGIALELGTYCGYGSLRIARAARRPRCSPSSFATANAGVARRIWAHAGVGDRVTWWWAPSATAAPPSTRWPTNTGSPQEPGPAVHRPRQERLRGRSASILDRGWLHRGFDRGRRQHPHSGRAEVPRIHARAAGQALQTVEHRAHGEYQTLAPDIVLESEYLRLASPHPSHPNVVPPAAPHFRVGHPAPPVTRVADVTFSAPAGGRRPTPRAGRAP